MEKDGRLERLWQESFFSPCLASHPFPVCRDDTHVKEQERTRMMPSVAKGRMSYDDVRRKKDWFPSSICSLCIEDVRKVTYNLEDEWKRYFFISRCNIHHPSVPLESMTQVFSICEVMRHEFESLVSSRVTQTGNVSSRSISNEEGKWFFPFVERYINDSTLLLPLHYQKDFVLSMPYPSLCDSDVVVNLVHQHQRESRARQSIDTR